MRGTWAVVGCMALDVWGLGADGRMALDVWGLGADGRMALAMFWKSGGRKQSERV